MGTAVTPSSTKRKVLLGVTAHPSAATCSELQIALSDCEVKVVLAEEGRCFVRHAPADLVDDEMEWYKWRKVGDEVLHIELTKWADCLLISPLSANYLAKLAHGLCDDLLTSIVRAWPPEKEILLNPVMHAASWRNPLTQDHFRALGRMENVLVLTESGQSVRAARFNCGMDDGREKVLEHVLDAVQRCLRKQS